MFSQDETTVAGRGRIITAALLAFLLAALPTGAGEVAVRQPKPFVRAIYGFRSDAEPFAGRTPDEAARQLLAWGCNAVFLKDEPAALIRTLHRQGIRCYREIGLFQGCRAWEEHPESRPVQADGTLLEKEEWYCGLCPNQPNLQQEKLQKIEEIAVTTEVDGIWLDFIRYPVHWESPEPRLPQTCFCPLCLEKFAADTRIALPTGEPTARVASFILENHFEAWYRWRAEQITGFVRRAAEAAKGKNPEILVGLFSVPWFRGERDDAIWKVVGQDFPALAAHVDVFSPMVYHRMVGEPPQWIAACTGRLSRETHKPVWPIIQGCSVPDSLSKEEFQEAIRQAELQPSEGIIIFAMNHLVKEKRLESLPDAWGKPQESRR